MKTKRNIIKNLAICILMVILGIAVSFFSFKLYYFRILGGWSFIKGSDYLLGAVSIGTMVLEWLIGLIGIVLFVGGCIGIYNNAKKMR